MAGWSGQGSGVRWQALALCVVLTACAQQRAPVVNLKPGSSAASQPAVQGRMHKVARGDTLYAIAWRYDTTVAALARINGLHPPYLIRVGQQLRVDETAAEPALSGGAVAIPIAEPGLVTGTGTVKPSVPEAATAPATTPPPLGPASAQTQPAQPLPPTRPLPSAQPLPPAQPPASPLPPGPTTAGSPQISAADRSWRWPAEGRITRQYDSNRQFKGINIQSRPGIRVLAAAPGEVVYAGDGLRGYGQLIIVKHDEAYLSAYAHNREMKVREGERVGGGQVIGEVGGDAANPGRLYFEIRKEGKPIDPTRLLPAQ